MRPLVVPAPAGRPIRGVDAELHAPYEGVWGGARSEVVILPEPGGPPLPALPAPEDPRRTLIPDVPLLVLLLAAGTAMAVWLGGSTPPEQGAVAGASLGAVPVGAPAP